LPRLCVSFQAANILFIFFGSYSSGSGRQPSIVNLLSWDSSDSTCCLKGRIPIIRAEMACNDVCSTDRPGIAIRATLSPQSSVLCNNRSMMYAECGFLYLTNYCWGKTRLTSGLEDFEFNQEITFISE
jgi:hypothetical protein